MSDEIEQTAEEIIDECNAFADKMASRCLALSDRLGDSQVNPEWWTVFRWMQTARHGANEAKDELIRFLISRVKP